MLINNNTKTHFDVNFSPLSQIKLDTKDPRRQKYGKKSHEMYMKRLKEVILKENHLSTSFPTDKSTSFTFSS